MADQRRSTVGTWRAGVVVAGLLAAACGGGGSKSGAPPSTATFAVGGAVSGLAGTGLTLRLNGGTPLAIASDGPFAFPAIADGTAWTVTVGAQPTGPAQTCAVTGGSGTLAGAAVTSVAVSCATATFAVGGTVSGLAGTGLTLRLNGGTPLAVASDGPFTFPALADGTAWTVTVGTQPSGPAQTCEVAGGTGTIAGAAVTGVAVTCATAWQGTKQDGVASRTTIAQAVAVDGDGNVWVVGSSNGALDGEALTGWMDAFVTRYDRSGTRLFTRLMGAAVDLETAAYGVAVDASGNAYVAGYTTGTLNETLAGTRDLFLAKYLPDGTRAWVHQRGVLDQNSWGTHVAVDGSGSVYVTGHTTGHLDGATRTGVQDMLLYKFDADGNEAWSTPVLLGATGKATFGMDLTADPSGGVWVVGYTNGAIGNQTQLGFFDAYVARYDASGARVLLKQFGVATGAAWVLGAAVRVTADGVFVAGNTNRALDATVSQTGTTDLFLARLGADGAPAYVRQLGVTGKNVYPLSLDADADGNLLLAGDTDGSLDGVPLRGQNDMFVARYPASGGLGWVHQLGYSNVWTEGLGVACDASGSAFVAGYTGGNLDGNVRTGTLDYFVAKWSAAGTRQ